MTTSLKQDLKPVSHYLQYPPHVSALGANTTDTRGSSAATFSDRTSTMHKTAKRPSSLNLGVALEGSPLRNTPVPLSLPLSTASLPQLSSTGPLTDDFLVDGVADSPLSRLDQNRPRLAGTRSAHDIATSPGSSLFFPQFVEPQSPNPTARRPNDPAQAKKHRHASSFASFGSSLLPLPGTQSSTLLVSPTANSRRRPRNEDLTGVIGTKTKRLKKTATGNTTDKSQVAQQTARHRGRSFKGTLNGGGLGTSRGGRGRTRTRSRSNSGARANCGGGTLGGHGVGRVPLPVLSEEQLEQIANMTVKKGKWSADEDRRLALLVDNYGDQEAWKHICLELGERNTKQCRERWNNHLDPSLRHGDWSPEEDRIIETMRNGGSGWAEIAKHLHGRTDNKVKIRYHSIVRRKLREQNAESQTNKKKAVRKKS